MTYPGLVRSNACWQRLLESLAGNDFGWCCRVTVEKRAAHREPVPTDATWRVFLTLSRPSSRPSRACRSPADRSNAASLTAREDFA